MPIESSDQSSIDTVHHKINDLRTELESFRQNPDIAAWIPGLTAMLDQLHDHIDMAKGDQAEIVLSQWAEIFATYRKGLQDLSPELGKSLKQLAAIIEKGIEAGWWRAVAELPDWAKDLDPADGHSLAGFKTFLVLLEALEDAEMPGPDYEAKTALEQRRKALQDWAQRWIAKGASLDGIGNDRITFNIPDEPTAWRWQAIEDFVVEWSGRAHEDLAGDELEVDVKLRHRALDDIKNLGAIPSGPGYHDTFDVIKRLLETDLDAIARFSWLHTRKKPEPALRDGESAARIADRTLNLRFFPELPMFIEYIERLWSAIENGEAPAEGIYEASIICKNLLCRSGNKVLDVLDRKLNRMVQLISERGEVPEHERRLLKLAETFAQGLAVYKHLDAGAFVAMLSRIEGRDETKGPRPPDDLEAPSDQAPTSLGSPRDFERCLVHAIYQTEVALKKQPLAENLAQLHRQLLKITQTVRYDRVLEEDQQVRVVEKLKTAASHQPENLASLLEQLVNYLQGKKIASRSVFADVLDTTIKSARSKTKTFSYAQARPIWAAVERQLIAVRRWTAGRRTPSALEVELTHSVLQESAAALEDNKTEAEFVRCIREIDAALQQWEALATDIELSWDVRPITTSEQLLGAIANMEDICQELVFRPAFTEPTVEQAPIVDIVHKLSKMKQLSKKGRTSTTQERAHVMSIVADADKVSPDLCPTIPDFSQVFIVDIQRLADGFATVMKTPAFADSEIRPLEKKGTDCHVISPKNWILMGFVQTEGRKPGLYRCGYEGVAAGEEADGETDVVLAKFNPNREKLTCLIPSEGKRITDLRWDPYGYMLAFRYPEEAMVGWVRAGNVEMPIEKGQVEGNSYIWTSKGDGLVVADTAAGKLRRIDIATGESLTLTGLDDDGDPELLPRMAVPSQGGSLAFTSRSAEASSAALWVLTYRRRRPMVRLVKQVPDVAATLLPFWLEPDQVGVMIISPAQGSTSIVSICLKEMFEQNLYDAETLEPARTPCASPSLRYLAFFRTSGLSLLDMDKGDVRLLVPSGQVDGELRFGKDIIFIEGGSAAHCVELKNLKDERIPIPSL